MADSNTTTTTTKRDPDSFEFWHDRPSGKLVRIEFLASADMAERLQFKAADGFGGPSRSQLIRKCLERHLDETIEECQRAARKNAQEWAEIAEGLELGPEGYGTAASTP